MIAEAAATGGWAAFSEGWHEFFLMTGTAAVTLAGLLFVAISLHVDVLVQPSRAYLLQLARAILMSYVMVLTLSLMMLVPGQGMRQVAVAIGAVGLIFTAITIRQIRARAAVDHPEFPLRFFRRRLVPMLFGYAAIAAVGAGMFLSRAAEFLYLLIGVFCMLLGNAVGASWDLLVRTARMRQGAEGKTAS